MKNLLIISHTPHVISGNSVYGWGPTVKEINFLSGYFNIKHIAPVHQLDDIPKSYLQVVPQVLLTPTRDRGGRSVLAKMRVIFDSLQYTYLILSRIRHSDMVHVRCPSNISLIALLILIFFFRKPKWIKYAGDWRPKHDYFSYWLQRFLIRNFLLRQVATVNDVTEDSPAIFHSFNPSYNLRELEEVRGLHKVHRQDAMNIIFVGGLSENKGVDIFIESIQIVINQLGISNESLRVEVIGDGPELFRLKELTTKLNLDSIIQFQGWRSGIELKEYYRKAHLLVLPSRGEGWPKVISEAMVYGVVPIVSDVSSIRAILARFEVGTVVESFSPTAYANSICNYATNPERWALESSKAMKTAHHFTYEHWASRLFHLFESHLSVEVSPDVKLPDELGSLRG